MTIETDHLRQHHRELVMLSEEIIASLDPAGLASERVEIRRMLSRLAGKLVYHLAYEDMSVYPSLLRHSNPQVKETVRVLTDEMGGLRVSFEEYIHRWAHDIEIRDKPDEFVVETLAILSAVKKRLEKEDNSLYILL